MSATVHTLHEGPGPETAAGAAATQIIGALEKMALSVISEQLRAMYESADDLLFEMAEKAQRGPEQQTFMDAMRIVRMQRPRMVKAFEEALHAALLRGDMAAPANVDLDDLDSWSLQDSSDLEEKIAVSNMTTKVDNLYATELRELEQRMTKLSDRTHGAVSPKALSSTRILESFQQSMKELKLDLPIKLVIYKLFDLTVVTRLGGVFSGANQVLEANGVKADGKPAKAKPKPLPRPVFDALAQTAAYGAMPQDGAGAPSWSHHPQLAAAMQSYLAPSGGVPQFAGGAPMPYAASNVPAAQDPHANSQLASEMLSVMEAIGHGRPANSWMPAQNLTLVSRMFDDMYTDSRLTDAARPMLGKLQFPVMKVALSDPTFFKNPAHPVRELVNDVFDTLATDGSVSGADFHRLEELIYELLRRFEPDPNRVRRPAPDVTAVSDAEAEEFLDQQKRRMETQRAALKEKVRRIVVQELRLHLADRRLPQPGMKLLLSGFGPLLASRYMNNGPTSAEWKHALQLLDRFLTSFDPVDMTAAERLALEEALAGEVTVELRAAAMPPVKIDAMIERLREAFADFAAEQATRTTRSQRVVKVEDVEPRTSRTQRRRIAAAAEDAEPRTSRTQRRRKVAAPEAAATPSAVAPAPAPAARAPESVLHLLMKEGEWFRVWEAATKGCRWLKLLHYYPAHDRLVFEDFAGEKRLQMKASVFGHDLAAGRSMPVSPSPATTELIQQLPPAPETASDPAASWFAPERKEQRAA